MTRVIKYDREMNPKKESKKHEAKEKALAAMKDESRNLPRNKERSKSNKKHWSQNMPLLREDIDK